MKKSKKLLIATLSVAVLLVCAVLAVVAASLTEQPTAVLNYIIGTTDEAPDYADANGDGKINVLDVLTLMIQGDMSDVYLTDLTLDDKAYVLDFSQKRLAYTVKLPAGRPNIPRISASAEEGLTVEEYQAYIPDGQNVGYAYVKVSNSDGESNKYTVRFERDIENGFVLQYDDRYSFSSIYSAANNEEVVYESSDDTVVSVDANGVMTAKKVSATPVTVTAKVGEETKATLTVNKVEKAHINLFLVTGQSNAQGCYSNTTANNATLVEAQLKNVEKIGKDGVVYSYDFHPRSSNTEVYQLRYTLYDMNTVRKQGFQNSLGKTWYELTGEKVVFLQTAYSGAPIQSWLDTETQPEAGKYSGRNFYDDTQKAYADLMPLLEDNYEIIRTANFWNQGGTAMASIYSHTLGNYINSGDAGYDVSKLMTDEEYYNLFMLMHADMKREFGIEFCGIFLNRVTSAATSAENKALQSHTDMVPIRSAQYGLHNTVSEISLVSRVGDFAKRDTWSDPTDYGYGFVDTDNTHFTQIGYNERGRVAAENAFAIWMCNEEAESVEIVAENGRDRLTSKNTIELKEGETYRLAGFALPMTSGEKTVLTSSNPAVASVNKYGVVTGNIAGDAIITATTESGKTTSVNVTVYTVIKETVTYRWDFNDLKATGTKNDLTLSECADYYGAGEHYSLTDGVYSVIKKSGDTVKEYRPDFKLEKAITLNNESDWAIEWRGYTYNTSCVLFGPDHDDPTGDTSKNGYIYLASTSDFDSSDDGKLYPLRFVPEKGNTLTLSYGDYKSLNYSMNTWKLDYTKNDNTITLYVSEDEGETWNEVTSAVAGVFSTSYETMFGRMRGNGYLNYYGAMDYVQVNFKEEYIVKGTDYYWDFNDLTSSSDKNDLTLSECAEYYNAKEYYTIKDSIYKTTASSKNRADFEMEKPVTLTSEKSWVIEWRGTIGSTSCVLLGSSQTDPASTASTYPFIYLWASSKVYSSKYGYPLKVAFDPSDTKNIMLNFGDYRTNHKAMNSWRIAYNKDTGVISLYSLNSATNVWELVDTETFGTFSMTFTNVFGRAKGNGELGYYGSMDYIKIAIED